MILVTGAVGLFGTTRSRHTASRSRLDYIMIPILFGLCTAVLTMVGVNIGAGQVARARQIAWTCSRRRRRHSPERSAWPSRSSRCCGCTCSATIAEVLHDGATYLRIVAPSYGVLGFGFVIAFAAQGAGHVLWPFVGAASRLVIAAGGGWIAVSYFGGGMATLAAMVCASLVSYALICLIAMGSKSVWRVEIP